MALNVVIQSRCQGVLAPRDCFSEGKPPEEVNSQLLRLIVIFILITSFQRMNGILIIVPIRKNYK